MRVTISFQSPWTQVMMCETPRNKLKLKTGFLNSLIQVIKFPCLFLSWYKLFALIANVCFNLDTSPLYTSETKRG